MIEIWASLGLDAASLSTFYFTLSLFMGKLPFCDFLQFKSEVKKMPHSQYAPGGPCKQRTHLTCLLLLKGNRVSNLEALYDTFQLTQVKIQNLVRRHYS